MIISPPFLPARVANQTDTAWLDQAFAPALPLRETNAPAGSYPLGVGLAWHNGLHVQGVAAADNQTPVYAIADGEVIHVSPPVRGNNEPDHPQNFNPFGNGATWTDNGLVILRHETEIGANGDQPTTLTYFSAYMHLNQIGRITPAGQQTARALQVRDRVYRKDEIGKAGQIYGHAGQIHLEVCLNQENLQQLIGRPPAWVDPANIPAPTADGRIDAVFGAIWFYLPATTPTRTTAPTTHLRAVSQTTLGQALWVRMYYESGNTRFETYDLTGRRLGERTETDGEYNLYGEASRRHNSLPATEQTRSSPSGWYELLRFGRNLGRGPNPADKDPLPNNVAHWRQINHDGQNIWIDLNTEGSFKFSDADFLPIQGWNFIDDDSNPNDQRCDSNRLKNLIADPNTPDRLATTTLERRLGDQEVRRKLQRVICRFPSEWDRGTMATRYGFVRELPAFRDAPGAWNRFEAHLNAITFNGLPADYLAAEWRVHPKVFIGWMRQCHWLQRRDLRRLFTPIDEAYLNQIRDELNKVSGKHFLNSVLRQAHFFGQIRQEAGSSMAATSENLNYAPSVLRSKFTYYAQNTNEADQDGYFRDTNGRITRPADQIAIANKAYGGRNGNDQPGDGWRYRGRGLKQLTGRENYAKFSDQYKKYWGSGWRDFEASPDLLVDFPYSLRSAVWFWLANECMKPADQGIAENNVDRVTAKVNSGELGRRNADGTYSPARDSPALNRRKYAKDAHQILI